MAETRLLHDIKENELAALNTLLVETVNTGASVGFLAPLPAETARSYWRSLESRLGDDIHLIVAEEDGDIIGAVQLVCCMKDNGRHRAEVQKLFVLPRVRGKGVASLLMKAIEKMARVNRISLLVLDTHEGSRAEGMYAHLGWKRAGMIPEYASTPDGDLHGTVFFYKQLS